jgi:hypothetical protein
MRIKITENKVLYNFLDHDENILFYSNMPGMIRDWVSYEVAFNMRGKLLNVMRDGLEFEMGDNLEHFIFDTI